jgi:hypothetical protein
MCELFSQDVKPAAKAAPAKKTAAAESSSEEESSDEDEEMPPAKVVPVKNGKAVAKAPVESTSEEEDSDDESEQVVKVWCIAILRGLIGWVPCERQPVHFIEWIFDYCSLEYGS